MKTTSVERDIDVSEIGEVAVSSEKFAVTSVVDELKDITSILDDRVSVESAKRAEAIEKIEFNIKQSSKKLDKKIDNVDYDLSRLSKVTDKVATDLDQAQSALDLVTKSFSQYVKHRHKMSFEFVVTGDNKVYILIKKLFKNLTYHEMMIETDASCGNQGDICAKKLRSGFIQIKHTYPSPACPTYKVSSTYIVNFEQKTYIKN